MADLSHPVGRVRYHAEKSLAEAGPWIVGLARAGYAAKGVVYCAVGLLALLAAFGNGGETTGSRGRLMRGDANEPVAHISAAPMQASGPKMDAPPSGLTTSATPAKPSSTAPRL